ncbi:MAG: hypothetical protein MSS47_05255 [Bacteroidales bacterium]|nr:hypothetical protein [Bacteroidales bacterium]
MSTTYAYLTLLAAGALTLCGCSDDMAWGGASGDNVINVGAEASGLTVTSDLTPLRLTRATGAVHDAEQVSWLIQPLKQGMDITFGKVGDKSTERVAILKLLGGTIDNQDYDRDPVSHLAVYSFNYRAADGAVTDDKARWLDNGPHYFEGVHVPTRIRFRTDAGEMETDRTDFNGVASVAAVKYLTTNQSGENSTGDDNSLGNYTLLAHYLGMPANTRISATVERIKLPFRHRLAHVMAYIIIDPELDTKIKGYSVVYDGEQQTITTPDDPNTTAIKFCNVDVLKGVHDVYNESTNLHTLTPVWAERVRKVTPHFYGEEKTMVVYKSAKEIVYPRNAKYEQVAASPAGYEQVTYHHVPIYDLIVRPTYTSYDNVMYDEEGYTDTYTREALANRTNQIDFLITLENGLTYEKTFVFDLDANYETVVYLHISKEGVDYNTSGADVWLETSSRDDWYGIDNKNGHTLSQAGSSWQRAYTRRKDSYINDGGDKVTDGGFYDEGTTGEDDATGRYLSEKTWIKYFSEAYEGGAHHGDYFNLSLDMTIDARMLPDNFVFTGHLNGFGEDDWKYHTITLTNTDTPWKEYVETVDYSSPGKLYDTKPAEAYSDIETATFELPKQQLYTKTHHEAVYYTADEIVEVDGKTYDKSTLDYVLQPTTEGIYKWVVRDDSKEATTDTIKTPAYDTYHAATPTLDQVMTGTTTYYTKDGATYTPYVKPTVLYRIVQHRSCTALFAGLNGTYTTPQEDNPAYAGPWLANVHKEGAYWLPYVDKVTNKGWRAEVLNLTVKGGRLFTDDAVINGKITGNVQNCKEDGPTGTYKVTDRIPPLPKY